MKVSKMHHKWQPLPDRLLTCRSPAINTTICIDVSHIERGTIGADADTTVRQSNLETYVIHNSCLKEAAQNIYGLDGACIALKSAYT